MKRGHPLWLKALYWLFGLAAGGAVCAVSLGIIVFSLVYQRLPDISSLTDYRPKIPLRVYSHEGTLLGEFGEERRDFVHLVDIPVFVRDAVLAAEDNGFYQHGGIEASGIIRAAITNLVTGRKGQGGSTITMQVARNFFLSSERTYSRKLYEVAMAYKIERLLSKDQILEVYLNQIYLGQRAYGFAAAARTYFGKKMNDLTVGEAATLAGLPVAPSAYNPVVNPARSATRKNYVLRRMRELGFISDETYQTELQAPIRTVSGQARTKSEPTVPASYAAEMARQLIFDFFGEDSYTMGLNVYTSIRDVDQTAATRSVRQHLVEYDRRYGYRGPLGQLDLSDAERAPENIRVALSKVPAVSGLPAAVITDLRAETVRVPATTGPRAQPARSYTAYHLTATLADGAVVTAETDSSFIGKFMAQAAADKKLRAGSVVRLMPDPKDPAKWTLGQVPEVQAGFVSADFNSGAVRSLVGGFDFSLSKFNHVTQALRQPGSSFKPFIYSAALDKGFNSATIINDAPIFLDPRLTGGELWEPRNYDGHFDGPMTLATALKRSKNLVSIRVMQAIGAGYAQRYVARFGFPPERTPAQLTTALGAGSTTPWEMAGAFSVFANGGFRVPLWLIERVTDADGKVIMSAHNQNAGDETIRAIDERNAFVMHTLLSGVTQSGTGARAYRELKRPDMGGKTGTTNNSYDAWFAGYAGDVVAVGWMGYDQMRPLGNRETGGGLMLPIWIDYMKAAVKDEPPYIREQPASVVQINDNYYYADSVDATVRNVPLSGRIEDSNRARDILRDQIF